MSLTQRRPLNSVTASSPRSPVTSKGLALHSPSYNGFFLEIGAADLPAFSGENSVFQAKCYFLVLADAVAAVLNAVNKSHGSDVYPAMAEVVGRSQAAGQSGHF